MKIKHLIFAMVIMLSGAVAYGAALKVPKMEEDGALRAIPGHAPDGRKTRTLTPVSGYLNLSTSVAWKITSSTNCAFRTATSATRRGPTTAIGADSPYVEVVNRKTPFLQWTSCNGTLRR